MVAGIQAGIPPGLYGHDTPGAFEHPARPAWLQYMDAGLRRMPMILDTKITGTHIELLHEDKARKKAAKKYRCRPGTGVTVGFWPGLP